MNPKSEFKKRLRGQGKKLVVMDIGLTIASLAGICPPLPAQGTLAVASFSAGSGANYGVFDSAHFTLNLMDQRGVAIFDSLVFTTNDVGRLFVITGANDKDFDYLVSVLTNGIPDWIGEESGVGSGSSGFYALEQDFFSPLSDGGKSPDFRGFHIDNIALQIEELRFTYPTAGSTVFDFRGRIFLNSEPVPTNPLSILLPPADRNAGMGSTVDLAVLAVGSPTLAYQWYFNGSKMSTDAGGCSLLLTNVQLAQSGDYRVVVTNGYGSITSSVATLKVTDPGINTQPARRFVQLGGNLSMSVEASGTRPLSYQWFKNGVNVNGAQSSTLQLDSAVGSDAGLYAVSVSNSQGSVTGLVATLAVEDPFINTQPGNYTAHAGETVQLYADAGGTAPCHYQWFRNGLSLSNGGTISGAQTSALTLTDVQRTNSSDYFFVISNASGSLTSLVATLTVEDPFVETQPAGKVMDPGEPVNFQVIAGGTQPLSYQWFKDGVNLRDGENISGSQSPTLALNPAKDADAGRYSVVISNALGSVSSSNAMLTVNSGVYSILHIFSGTDHGDGSSPNAGLLLSGTTLIGTTTEGGSPPYGSQGTVFKLNTDGTGFMVVRSFDGRNNGNGPSGNIALSGTTLYGTTYMGGTNNYGVLFKVGIDGSNFMVLKHFSVSDGAEPAGVRLFGDTLYGATGLIPVLFKINTDGSGYTVLRKFLDGGGACPDLLVLGSELYGTGAGGSLGKGSIFTIDTNGNNFTVLRSFASTNGEDPEAGLISSNGTLYGTMASGGSNGCGTVFKVNADGSHLVVLKHFAGDDGSYPNTHLVLSGSRLFGSTAEGGSANLGTIFMLNADGSGFKVLRSFTGADGAYPSGGLLLAGSTLYGTTPAGGGNYGVVFSLLLAIPPSMLTPPQTQTAELDSTVDLGVRITGAEPLFYQWFFNGNAICGCTNRILCLSGVQATNVGTYSVVVSNIFGIVTSSPAMLNAIPPVERRLVPAINVMASPGSALGLDYCDALDSAANWETMATMTLSNTSQFYFDVSELLPMQRFYRAWQTGTPAAVPSLSLPGMAPAITLTGTAGDSLRVDGINQFGPTDAWLTLDTVTLTNTSQLYFDVSAIGQPARLYRIVPAR